MSYSAYSEEQSKEVVQKYQNGVSVEELAKEYDRTVYSIRGLLIYLNVYVPKKVVKKEKRITKKEHLAVIDKYVPWCAYEKLKNCSAEGVEAIRKTFIDPIEEANNYI